MLNEALKNLSADLQVENRRRDSLRLLKKWKATELLEGLDQRRAENVAQLLENQLKYLVKEASTGADIIGIQNVAFPIVRRVFAGLIANELVAVQPLSLPSGLIFYMDYRYDTVKAGNQADDFTTGGSVFGDRNSLQENRASGGPYNFSPSFSLRERISQNTFSATLAPLTLADIDYDPELSASLAASSTGYKKLTLTNAFAAVQASGGLTSAGEVKMIVPVSGSSTSWSSSTDGTPVRVGVTTSSGLKVFRRFTQAVGNDLTFVVSGTAADVAGTAYILGCKVSYPVGPTLTGGTSGTLVLDPFESDLGSPAMPQIPQLDFRIQSDNVVVKSRKLAAKWTPELAQDLAAYQNLDAEVELTQVMSEQMALDIDREILAELLYSATGANYYWSRAPGKFLDKTTGVVQTGATFTGTVREWYETLVEVCIDVANTIQAKSLRGAANFAVTSPFVSTILEASVQYKPIYDPADTMMTTMKVGTEKIGSITSRFTVYRDPYFPKNKILLGYKGSTFLETGYVYAPYIPLIVTPTIYKFDDFTPTKGVMTRYAKKLIRSDFYGTVTIMDMNYP